MKRYKNEFLFDLDISLWIINNTYYIEFSRENYFIKGKLLLLRIFNFPFRKVYSMWNISSYIDSTPCLTSDSVSSRNISVIDKYNEKLTEKMHFAICSRKTCSKSLMISDIYLMFVFSNVLRKTWDEFITYQQFLKYSRINV